jgi:hypothetical protein
MDSMNGVIAALSALSNPILVAITFVYAFITYRILVATRRATDLMHRQFEESLRPYIAVDVFVERGSHIFRLRIRNLGKSAAANLRLSLDRDFCQFGNPEHNLRNTYAFRENVATFPPNFELIFDLDVSHQVLGKKAPEVTPTKFKVSWFYTFVDKHYEDSTEVDLETFLDSCANPEPLVDELRGISKSLEKLASAIKDQQRQKVDGRPKLQ